MMPEVFISYGREDQRSARALHSELRAAGVDTWLDVENLRPGEHWKETALAALRASDYVLLLLSANSVGRRGFINTEIREALRIVAEMPRDRPFLLPVRLDECETSHLELLELNYVDIFESWEDGVRRILSVVQPSNVTQQVSAKDRPNALDSPKDDKPYGTVAFVQIRVHREIDLGVLFRDFKNESVTWDLNYCFGPWDYVLFCRARDVREVEAFVIRLRAVPAVKETFTILGVPIAAPR